MRCCICGEDFNGFGNNPFPLVQRDDYESRCCNDCDEHVVSARLLGLKKQLDLDIKQSDEELTKFLEDKYIVIFWSSRSNLPTDRIKNTGKFLTGEIIGQVAKKKVAGSWGNFLLDLEKDSYIVINSF